MDLILGRTLSSVRLAGEIDLVAAEDLRSLLGLLEPASTPVCIEMARVTFIDTSGVTPLMEAVRLREQDGLRSVRVDARSRHAQFFLDAAGLDGAPHLDLTAWDRLAEQATKPQ